MLSEKLKSKIDSYKDFPKKGILFRDLSPVLLDPYLLDELIREISNFPFLIEADGIVAIDARGFIFASSLAYKLNKGFVMIRKKNKLPGETIKIEYELEYGKDTLEVNVKLKSKKILLVDDLLATGGTANAVSKLVSRLEGNIISVAFLIELTELKGCDLLKPHNVFSILNY